MSADNQEFLIPFEESRRGSNSNPEEKAALGRLGRYLGSRAIDRPTIGDRRNRGRNNRDFDLPTGGKPGTRTPTGSRTDIDGDGWADEGTTKPVWVGIDAQGKKPGSPSGKKDTQVGVFSRSKDEQGDISEALSSGKKYQEIVDSQEPLSEEKKEIISEFSDSLTDTEFQKADVYILDTRPQPPRPPGMPESKPRKILQDSEERILEKERVRNLLADAFKGEMTFDEDIILKGDDGQELNIGKKVLVEVPPHATYSWPIKINEVTDNDLKEQRDMGIYDELMEEGDLLTEITLNFRIKPLPEYNDKVLDLYSDDEVFKYVHRADGMPPRPGQRDGTPSIATASRTFMRVTGEEKDVRVVSHDSFYVNRRAQGKGIGSEFNARNEQLYKELGLRNITTWGYSGGTSRGATHWPKNGFTWGGEQDKQKFIGIIDNAIIETPELFSDADRKKISSMYSKDSEGFWQTEATAEELLDFPAAEKVFSDANGQIFYTRPLRELTGASSSRDSSRSLSSGKNVSELYDGEYGTWKEGEQLTPDSLSRLISMVFEENDVDASLPKYEGALEKLDDYKEFGYGVNDLLRSWDGQSYLTFDKPQNSELGQYQSMQRLLMDNRTTAGITLYRAITRRPEIENLQEGDVFGDRGFQSFSLMSPGQYTGQGSKRPIVLRLLTTKNTRGRYISRRPRDYDFSNTDKTRQEAYFGVNEHEMLLPAGATYKLVKKTETDDGKEIWDVKLSKQGVLSSGAKEVKLDNVDSETLSSGKAPRYPRTPTLGAFLGKADEDFADVDSWEEFKRLYDDKEVVFFDYETTGLVFGEFGEELAKGAPVQFGAVKIKNGKEVGRINLFMNPEEELGEWSRKNLKDVDGNPLTDEWLRQQMSVADAHRQLVEFAGPDALFGVQNATFDKGVLDGVLEQMGEEWRPSGYLDTREIAALTLPKWTPENEDGPFTTDRDGNKKPSSSLAAITEYLGVDLGDGHHNADVDAFATSQVMQRMIDGAIEKGWSKDALNKEKRDALHRATVDKFDSEVVQFEKDKQSYSESLSSGRQRPLIPMKKAPERKPAEPGKRGVKGYGQKDDSGNEVRRSSTKWLAGMTSEEMSIALVPSSKEEHFEMWADDLAVPGWNKDRKYRKFLKEYYDQLSGHENALRIDYSPEGIEASRELVRSMLDSSPQMKWMFENFGAPLVGVFTRDAMNEYEGRPDVKERMELLRQQRGMEKTPFVSGLASREFGFVGLTPRALIDRESYDNAGAKYPLELDPNRKPALREAHIDRSLHGTLIHEYGHWLHYRAIRDLETNISGGSKTYYGSGKLDDPSYRAALDIAEEYANPDTDNEAIEIYSQFIDLTGRDAEEMFKAYPDKALIATSYGNVNKREAIAEAFVAIMHPNKDLAKSVLSPKLRRDIYTLSGVDPDNLPWEARPDGRPTIRLSSGAQPKPERENRRNRISRALRQLVGADKNEQEETEEPNIPYEFEAPERPEGLASFAPEPSDSLRDALPIPTESDMTEELVNDVKQIPIDPILEKLSSLKVSGFGVSMFSSEEERKASSAAKRMISLNVSETANLDPREFVESFSDESIAAAGLDPTSQKRFFNAARNFKALKEIFDAIDALPEDASDEDKAKARRFAVDRTTGSLVSTENHDKIIQKRFYYDEMIDKLEERSYEELFGPEWEDLTRIALNDEKSVVSPYLLWAVGGDDAKREMISFGQQIRGMLGEFMKEIKRETGSKPRDPFTGRELGDDEGLALVFAPLGEIDPRTGKPGMAIVSTTGTATEAMANDMRLLVSGGKLVPENERTDEQHRAYDRLYVKGIKDDYLQKLAEAGMVVVDKTNVDSDETKELFRNFLINRLRFIAGNAESYKAQYEFTSGVSFFDIETPEGLREAKASIVSDIIHTWAISANNSNPVAMAIQHEARKMFGLDEAVGWYGRVRGPREGLRLDSAIPVEQRAELGDLAFDDTPELSPQQAEIIGSVVKGIYDATQHYYKSKGITHVAIWRGMKGTPEMVVPRGELAERRVSMRPLSSWTTNSNMAQMFSTTLASTKRPGIDSPEEEQAIYDENLLMKAYVPIEQIFSNPLTGFGCLGEDEVVLLGRPTDTIMITPPANFLPEAITDESVSDDVRKVTEDILSFATNRDKVTNAAYRQLTGLGYGDFNKRFGSRSSEALSSGALSPGTKLSSGKVIKYNFVEARMRASDIKVTFNRDPERVAAVKATLAKGFMGGFTVEVDRMDDIKEGIAIARNKHGMKVDAVADFDAEGNPSDELVDTFLAWMDFHGPKTFMEPKSGAEKTTIGGWVSEGTVYLDVVDVYPNTEENLTKAADMGLGEDQIAVTNLNKLWELLESGEDVSPAFIDSGGTGGFTLDEESVKRVSAALSDLNSNKFNTGSMQLKRIGNTKKFTKGPVSGARRVRNTDFATGEKQDYWIIAGANGMVKVFTHDQYLKVRDKKIQGLFDKMSTQSDILASMFEAKNIKPAASMSFFGGRNVGKAKVAKEHKNRGLTSGMANLYGFSNNLPKVGIQMGDKIVAAMI